MMNYSLQRMGDFLSALKEENSKEWFEENRSLYDAAREDFVHLLAAVVEALGASYPELQTVPPKKFMYRLHRDLRFSKNKTPYKTHFGALLVAGKRSELQAAPYFHFEPENIFFGAGLYAPPGPALKKIRAQIDLDGDYLLELMQSDAMQRFYPEGLHVEKNGLLKTAPRDYPKDHEHIALLRHKHFFWQYNPKPEEITEEELPRIAAEAYRAVRPCLDWLNHALKKEEL